MGSVCSGKDRAKHGQLGTAATNRNTKKRSRQHRHNKNIPYRKVDDGGVLLDEPVVLREPLHRHDQVAGQTHHLEPLHEILVISLVLLLSLPVVLLQQVP